MARDDLIDLSSVVRIYATSQRPDYDSPWQAASPASKTGSGVVVGPGQVLTGAHVVANATFLQVQKVSDPSKFVARVAGICHDCDLALLEVHDPRFDPGVAPVTIGDLPELRDRVSVVGFPVGGDEVSITEGVVSRIEVQRYSHSQRFLLAITIDAAINAGNSGGPVVRGGQVVGIAFQTLADAENIGEMVPPPLIQRFLHGVREGKPLGVPSLSVRTQTLENPALRRACELRDGESGVRVRAVEHGGSADGVLQNGDVILAVDGHRLHDNGTILYRGRFRTRFDAVIGERFVDERVDLSVRRGGEHLNLSVALREPAFLVPRSQYDMWPRYYVFGGLVFQPLSRNYLETWNRWWDKAPPEFLNHYYSSLRREDRLELIALTHILADELSVGYEDHDNETVLAVNGRAPRDLADFVRLVESAQGMVHLQTSCGAQLSFDVEQTRAGMPRILERYRIPADRSPELR